MSKSILVIDTPSCCEECEICRENNGIMWCGYHTTGRSQFLPNTRADYCPLKDLAEGEEMSVGGETIFGYEREMMKNKKNNCEDFVLVGTAEQGGYKCPKCGHVNNAYVDGKTCPNCGYGRKRNE